MRSLYIVSLSIFIILYLHKKSIQIFIFCGDVYLAQEGIYGSETVSVSLKPAKDMPKSTSPFASVDRPKPSNHSYFVLKRTTVIELPRNV